MFRILLFIIAISLAFADDWVHYSGYNTVYDVAEDKNKTLWAALNWGIQEKSQNNSVKSYPSGINGLYATDFVQIFALPGGDIIAVAKNGTIVKKNKTSNNFEVINTSFVEKKRNLETGLGKHKENILVLPFNGAIAFFDYEQNRSVITFTQIGNVIIGNNAIKRIAIKDDSIWVDLSGSVWKRTINWKEIYSDAYFADPTEWKKAPEGIPFEEAQKPIYEANPLNNFNLHQVKNIAVNEDNAVVWGIEITKDNNSKLDYLIKIKGNEWGERFYANPSNFIYDGHVNTNLKTLVLQNDGSFATGRWGSGFLSFNNSFPVAQMNKWLHSTNPEYTCPTTFQNDGKENLVTGVVAAPNSSGYIFSYISQDNYGLGFLSNNGNVYCPPKSSETLSPYGFSVITKENENGEWEIFVTWSDNMHSVTGGGVERYKVSNPNNFAQSLKLEKSYKISFGAPIDFVFDKNDVLWAVSSSKLFYLDANEDEWKDPTYIRGFNSSLISALEKDAQNNLWVGTFDNGAYMLSQVNNYPDSLVAKHFNIKNGLLNEFIYDIAIDTIKGKVYFGHDLGLSIYSTALVRNSSSYMQEGSPKPIAYPNPFRPKIHSSLTIDFINDKAKVYILDSSGKRVKFFKGEQLRGGAVSWDGKNENGKLVAPGLYHYIASDGKEMTKGKIIIER